MITIVQGTTNKPVSARRLADFFARPIEDDGFLYIRLIPADNSLIFINFMN